MNRKIHSIILFLLTLLAGMVLENLLGDKVRSILSPTRPPLSNREVADKTVTDTPGTLVLFTAGQSNASNHVKSRYTPKNAVFTLYNYQLYKTKDPLLNACGWRGSLWSALADMLIDSALCKQVILVNTASGGSSVTHWAYKEGYQKKLQESFMEMDSLNIHPHFILWVQGEKDNEINTPSNEYVKAFLKLKSDFRKAGITASFIMSITSYSPAEANLLNQAGIDTAIQNAQLKLIQNNSDILQGPWTDSLILASHRRDGQHFSDFGAQLLVKEYFNIIKKQLHSIPSQP